MENFIFSACANISYFFGPYFSCHNNQIFNGMTCRNSLRITYLIVRYGDNTVCWQNICQLYICLPLIECKYIPIAYQNIPCNTDEKLRTEFPYSDACSMKFTEFSSIECSPSIFFYIHCAARINNH